ncbi:hypothetical protein EP7_004259 [Isosphaeraceae bacterium EP7]
MSRKPCKGGMLITIGAFRGVYCSSGSLQRLSEMLSPPIDEEELEAIRLRIINGGKS